MKIGSRKLFIRIALGITAAALLGTGVALVWPGSRARAVPSPEALASEVHQALQTQQWATAESLLKDLPPSRAAAADVAILRAEFEGSQGRVDAAAKILASIPETDPLAARSRLLIGQIEKSRDHARKSEAAFLEAIRLDPKLVEARRELAYLYGIQGRREEIKNQFLALAKLDALDINGVFLWTHSNIDTILNPANRPILERFVATDPDDRWSRLALAEVLIMKRELDKAEEVARPLPNTDPEALGVRLKIALNRAQIDDARALAALGPAEHPILSRIRGQLALKSRDPAAAVQQFQIALRLDPTNREVVQGLATAHHLLGDAKEERIYHDFTNKLRSFDILVGDQLRNFQDGKKDPAIPKQMGAACESVGLPDEARVWYQLAIGIDPLDAAVQKALHRLKPKASLG